MVLVVPIDIYFSVSCNSKLLIYVLYGNESKYCYVMACSADPDLTIAEAV